MEFEALRYPEKMELIDYTHPLESVFFSDTAWPIKAKFHMEPSFDLGETKICLNGSGHMTKTIHGINL